MKRKRSVLVILCSLFLFMGIAIHSMSVEAQKRGTNIKLNDIIVVGKIQKPQAFYVLHRAPLNYKNFQMKRSYIKKVIDAVKKTPF